MEPDGRFVTSAYQAYGDRMLQLAQSTVDAWSAPDSDSGQTRKRHSCDRRRQDAAALPAA